MSVSAGRANPNKTKPFFLCVNTDSLARLRFSFTQTSRCAAKKTSALSPPPRSPPPAAGSRETEGGREEEASGVWRHVPRGQSAWGRSGAREPRSLTRCPRAKPETERSEREERSRRRGKSRGRGRGRGRKGAFTRRASLVKVIKRFIMLRLFVCLFVCVFGGEARRVAQLLRNVLFSLCRL